MASKVIDASALAAIVFREPEISLVLSRVDGAKHIAPVLLPFELGNVCAMKMRRRPERARDVAEGYARRTLIPIELHDVDLDAAVALADRLRLTACDASYLWLARRLDVELVTLDAKLAAAARP